MATWTLREIAREAGRPVSVAHSLARAGLVPGYRGAGARQPAQIPDAIAADVIVVLRLAVCSSRFVELMKSDPAAAREGVDALERLVSAAESAGEAPAA